MKRILVLGSQGQVGFELCRSLAVLGEVIAFDRAKLDLTDEAAVDRILETSMPHLIVNAAAYTAVDRAETEKEQAFAINAKAPERLARKAKELDALLVHYSTDYVFDGSNSGPYSETQLTNPQNVYGQSKLAGEKAIQEVDGQYLILRTSWVYGTRGKNFLLTMLKLGKERDELKIVNDQFGAPTWCRTIADTTAHLYHQSILTPQNFKKGIYNLASSGQTTWHGFAEAIFAKAAQKWTKTPRLIGIPASEYPLPAKRPANSTFELAKIQQTFKVHLPHWQDALMLCLDESNML